MDEFKQERLNSQHRQTYDGARQFVISAEQKAAFEKCMQENCTVPTVLGISGFASVTAYYASNVLMKMKPYAIPMALVAGSIGFISTKIQCGKICFLRIFPDFNEMKGNQIVQFYRGEEETGDIDTLNTFAPLETDSDANVLSEGMLGNINSKEEQPRRDVSYADLRQQHRREYYSGKGQASTPPSYSPRPDLSSSPRKAPEKDEFAVFDVADGRSRKQTKYGDLME